MAAPDLENRYIAAGHEFSDALENLGLDADGIFWGYDQELGNHVLVLITDFFDFKGPLEISKHLFRAYNASATPQEIDPFVVRMHIVNQSVGKDLLGFVAGDWTVQKVDKATGKSTGPVISVEGVNSAGLDLRKEWVIRVRPARQRKSVEINRRWERFSRNVEKLAA